MTKHTWTNIVSALLFLACVAVASFVPTPFVTWTPGDTYDLLSDSGGAPVVSITEAETYPVTGQLRMTTVGVTTVDARVNLIQVLVSHLSESQDVLPREVVYPPQLDAPTYQAQETAQMNTSQSAAVVAGLRAAGVEVRQLPVVVAVAASGPSAGHLQPGDLVTAIDGTPVANQDEIRAAITSHSVGEPVVVGFLRDSVAMTETITTRASASQADVPAIGVTLGVGYIYAPRVSFGIDPNVGGPSAGLMFALTIYDKLTPGDLAAGRVVAGTGTINEQGTVGPIGGVQEKLAAAERDHAELFIMPRSNCADLTRASGVRVVAVSTLQEAIGALAAAEDPAAPAPSGCG